jgi:hypothetical protein
LHLWVKLRGLILGRVVEMAHGLSLGIKEGLLLLLELDGHLGTGTPHLIMGLGP